MKTWLLVAAVAVASLTAACGPVQMLCHEVGDACGADGECCSFGCVEGVCKANPLPDGLCRTSNDCVGGLVCEDGHCKRGDRPDGDVCRNASDCASDRCVDGKCTARTDCGSPGGACTSSSQCCSGLQCVGGKCATEACRTSGSTCTESVQCCNGLGCGTGTCSSVCRSHLGACTQDNDCCSGYGCVGGVCRSGCAPEVATCDLDSDCCAGTRCAADSTGTRKCRQGQLGESCTQTAECDDAQSLICNAGKCDYAVCRQYVGDKCLDSSDCCAANGLDCGPQGTCCKASNAACDRYSGTTAGCCPGTLCLDATGTCGACLQAGQPSAASNDCCSTARNSATGNCCLTDGSASTQNSLCCSGTQQAGACCRGEGSACDTAGTQCCGGLVCDPDYTGSSSYKTCRKPVGSGCTPVSGTPASNECEGGDYSWCAVPVGGTSARCCIAPAGACDANSDCCSGTCGTDGKCTQMPAGGSCDYYGNHCDPATTSNCFGDTCCAGMGQACGASAPCCDDPFTFGQDLACGSAQKCCKPSNSTCTAGSECCSGTCTIKPNSTSGTCA